MNSKIELKTVIIETQIDGVKLKGTLEYWGKGYSLKLDEPFKSHASKYQLQFVSPVKYVIEKSQNPTSVEIDLIEKSKELLKSVYTNKINTKGDK